MSRIKLLTLITFFSLAVMSSYSQVKDNYLERAQQLLENYQFDSPAPPSSETPEESWKRFYQQPNPSVSKTLGYHVNMMPSFYTSGNYANFVINQAGDVWGNVNGGTSPYRYYLDYGDGTIDSGTVSNPKFIGASHTYAFAGVKTAELLVIDNAGLRDSDQTVIRVFASTTKQIRINQAIDKGLVYLYKNQNASGWWYSSSGEYGFGTTGIALLAFEENGHRPLNDQNKDIYAEYVRLGLNWLMTNSSPVNVSSHGGGDPEELSKNPSMPQYGYGLTGKGVTPYLSNSHGTYATSCAMLGIVGAFTSGDDAKTDTIKVGTYATFFNSTKGYYPTYYDYMVDATELFSHTQGDGTSYVAGGWQYSIISVTGNNGHYNAINESGYNDGSANQWPVLLFDAAKDAWGIDVPSYLKPRARNAMIALTNANGGVGYTSNASWLNTAKTASAVIVYAWIDSTDNYSYAKNGIKYVSDRWYNHGYGGSDNAGWIANMYAMYGVKKSLVLINSGQGIQNITYTYSSNTVTRNWQDDLNAYLLGDWSLAGGAPPGVTTTYTTSQAFGQYSDGHWQCGEWPITWNEMVTPLSILILTQGVIIAPPVAVISTISSKPALFPFDVSASQSFHQNPEKSIVEYLWDWDISDGVDWENPDDFGPNPVNPGYDTPGTYTISLRIEDDSDDPLFASSTINVTIDSAVSSTNHAPIAVPIPKDRQPFYAIGYNLPLLFDARDSYDPDLGDEIVSYSWDLDGNGTYGDATTDTVTRVYTSEFDGEIGLRVTDSRGATSTNLANLRVVSAQRNVSVVSFDIQPRVVFKDSTMRLTAIFENDALSDQALNNILVRFYDNDPLTSGSRLGRTDYFVSLPVGGRDTLEVDYTIPTSFADGNHTIYVYCDASSQINEWNEIDNRQKVTISAGSPNAVTIRKLRDSDGKSSTITDRQSKSWFLSLYQDSISENTRIASGDAATLVTNSLPAGNYIAVEADSAGWRHLSTSVDGVVDDTTGSAVAFTLNSGEAKVVEFVNYLVNSVTIKCFADEDRDFNTSGDRVALPWRLSLYRNAVAANNLVESVSSDSVLTVQNLGSGIYIAVQEDSSSVQWAILGNTLIDNTGSTNRAGAYSAVSVSLIGGQNKEIHFVNARAAEITVRKFVDYDGNITTTDDWVETPFEMYLYKNSVAPENLIASNVDSSYLKADSVSAGVYVAVEADVDGYLQLGYVNEDGITVKNRTHTITFTLKPGARPTVAFVNFTGDTTYMRTFTSDSALFATKTSKFKPKTFGAYKVNFGHLRDSIFKKAGKTGVVLGIPQTNKDSIKRYAWIKIDKGGAAKFLSQTGDARGFDTIKLFGKVPKKFLKELKNPTPKKYNNHLAGEMFVTKFNLLASEFLYTPGNLRNIVYDDGTEESNLYNGMTIADISKRIDSITTYYKYYPDEDYELADSILTRINRAFAKTLDSSDIIVNYTSTTSRLMSVTGVRSVLDIAYLLPPAQRSNSERKPDEILIPTQVELYQNYPNPFNPSTTIEFYLPEDGFATLKVYNILGQEVATILNREFFESGYQEIEFDASQLSSGVYFVRLETNGTSMPLMQKMLLLK